MFKTSILKTLLGAATILSSSSASAALFDLNTTNFGLAGSSTVDSASMTVDGITVDLTAFTIANDGGGVILGMTQLSGGTGVYVSNSSNNVGVRSNTAGDGTNMDGGAAGDATDLDEGILFTFDQVVTLTFVNFDSFSGSDDFNLTVDGISLLVDHNQTDSDVPGIVSNTLVADHFDFSVVGTEFLIWADGSSDSFRIDSLRASAVPVPAAAWLFGSGLLALFGVSRRKA